MTPAAVARLERGETDPKLSLLTRFAAALGQELELNLKEQAPV
jgi:transcriptional regulator with XRE-family HTH domain